MNHFPALSSALSPPHLAELVIEKYGFGKSLTCQTIRLGVNHSYLISDASNKYVLRVYHYNWRTEKEVLAEVELLNWLKANQISLAAPIPDINQNYIQRINACEGERFAVLFDYAEGEQLKNMSEEHCHQLGIEMAKIHQLTLDHQIHRKTYSAKSLVTWALQMLRQRFDASLEAMEYFARANAEITKQFAEADTSQLRMGVVHLDIWSDNLKVKTDSSITLFDFDNCGNGYLFLDIAYTLMLLFRGEADKAIFEKKSACFYEGYESICPVSAEEKRLIPYGGLAIWLHYSGIHSQRFDDFTNPFFSAAFLKHWVDNVNVWMVYNKVEI